MTSPYVISGTVRDHAQARRTRDGDSLLTFELATRNMSMTRPVFVRVVHPYGTGEAAAYAAKARATRLRRGVRVVVHCQGLGPARGALVAQAIERIDEPDLSIRPVAGLDQ